MIIMIARVIIILIISNRKLKNNSSKNFNIDHFEYLHENKNILNYAHLKSSPNTQNHLLLILVVFSVSLSF